MKDIRFFLQLTKVMKIVRHTSLFYDTPCLSLQNPRLRCGKRLAHLSLLNLTINLCILSFVLSLALRPHLSSLVTFSTVPLPGSGLGSLPIT